DGLGRLLSTQEGSVPAVRPNHRPIPAFVLLPPYHAVLLHVEVPTQPPAGWNRSTTGACEPAIFAAAVSEALMNSNANPYLALGVRPFINCCSVRTMHGGSLMLPQVRTAVAEASRYFVNLDELM